MPKPKPDDRSDNPEKLKEMIANTENNINEANDDLKAHSEHYSEEEIERLEEKNERRRISIDGFRDEIKDEIHDREI